MKRESTETPVVGCFAQPMISAEIREIAVRMVKRNPFQDTDQELICKPSVYVLTPKAARLIVRRLSAGEVPWIRFPCPFTRPLHWTI